MSADQHTEFDLQNQYQQAMAVFVESNHPADEINADTAYARLRAVRRRPARLEESLCQGRNIHNTKLTDKVVHLCWVAFLVVMSVAIVIQSTRAVKSQMEVNSLLCDTK